MTTRIVSLCLCCCFHSALFAQSYRNQDAALGGLAGAVIGGIIGHQNDETPEGALIGGAVGAVTGGLLGHAKDEQIARQRYHTYQAHHVRQQQICRAVSPDDVINMSRNGLSDTVIVNHIHQHGVTHHMGTHDIIGLHKQGVNETVITAMQSAQVAGQRVSNVVVEPARTQPTVVVREEYHVVPTHRHYIPPARVRYATRPAFPTYPSRIHFHRYW